MLVDGDDVGAEIEDALHPGYDGGEGTDLVYFSGTGKFTLKLVAVSGSSVSGEIGTDGKLVAPITVG